ncbi:endonuclease-reverse transcriptase [Elysia marginata]|uniref:Endonuclease-reverse transcriptase n=1 Tax=Elysia marginata TaxID=1093978 RepID=A0AAV4FS46_9GAST|nr:endonuclease-reverse transcriptase [Elysia marginata]
MKPFVRQTTLIRRDGSKREPHSGMDHLGQALPECSNPISYHLSLRFGIRRGAAKNVLTTAFHSCLSSAVRVSQCCPFSDVVFPAFFLPTSPSISIYGILYDGLGKARRASSVPTLFQFPLPNDGQKATSAVFCNNKIGDWFTTTVRVRQGCLLSPTLFNIFLERILTDALEDHFGTVSFGGRPITKLRFPDDIDGLAGNDCEMASLVEQLDKASSNFDMEISAEKTNIMTNRKESSKKKIKVNGQILERLQNSNI